MTTGEGLVERLRRTQGTGVLDDGTLVPVWCVNPDGYEAAARIEQLEAQLVASREALAFYADRSKYQHPGSSRYFPLADDEGKVARAALAVSDVGGGD